MKAIMKSIKKHIIVSIISVCIVCFGIGLYFLLNDNKFNLIEVYFDTSGGTQVETVKIKKGEKIQKPANPQKEGFKFVNWYYNGDIFDFNTSIFKTINLIAKWDVLEGIQIVEISFDANGGSKVENIQISKGEKIQSIPRSEKDGYELKGWYFNGKKFDFSTDINEDLTLVAIWKKKDGISSDKNINNDNTNNNINNDNNNINNNNDNNNDNNQNEANTNEIEKCSYNRSAYIQTTYYIQAEKIDSVSPYHYYWNTNNGCYFTAKNKDLKIATISFKEEINGIVNGTLTGVSVGETNISLCINDKSTKEELECIKVNVNVSYNKEKLEAQANKLLKELDGYYWYLDGYKYAYMHAKLQDWHGHEALIWDSENINYLNNKFIASEDTGEIYYTGNTYYFDANPSWSATELILKYNMNVKNNKLYITTGGKTYSFSRFSSKRKVELEMNFDKTNINVVMEESFNLTATIYPIFLNYNITIEPTFINYGGRGSTIAGCSQKKISKDKILFECSAAGIPGNGTLKFIDSTTGSSKSIPINVSYTYVHPTGVTLDNHSIILYKGNSQTLKATISPWGAIDKSVKWISSDTNIAKVERGKVIGVNPGKAIITVETNDGGFTDSCEVEIILAPLTAVGKINVNTITIGGQVISSTIGAYVEVAGGTGSYFYDYFKLYKDDMLVSEIRHQNGVVIPYEPGNYTLEYKVRDTNGTIYEHVDGPYKVN